MSTLLTRYRHHVISGCIGRASERFQEPVRGVPGGDARGAGVHRSEQHKEERRRGRGAQALHRRRQGVRQPGNFFAVFIQITVGDDITISQSLWHRARLNQICEAQMGVVSCVTRVPRFGGKIQYALYVETGVCWTLSHMRYS